MKPKPKYVVFKTKWGWFGLAAGPAGLLRSCLPAPKAHLAKARLLRELPGAEPDKQTYKGLQEQIRAYFDGENVDFSRDIPIVLAGLSDFTQDVLSACRTIRYGRRLSYSQLAERLARPRAARAVGNALAKNPILLIIPCHRVVRSDGRIGGFSAVGGVKLKKKMFRLEQETLRLPNVSI